MVLGRHGGTARASVTRESLAALRSSAVPIVVTVALFLVFGLALAWCLWRFTDFDAHTALLATAPGGIAQMGAFSAEVKANVPWCCRSTSCASRRSSC